jgi:hypothetical protein
VHVTVCKQNSEGLTISLQKPAFVQIVNRFTLSQLIVLRLILISILYLFTLPQMVAINRLYTPMCTPYCSAFHLLITLPGCDVMEGTE